MQMLWPVVAAKPGSHRIFPPPLDHPGTFPPTSLNSHAVEVYVATWVRAVLFGLLSWFVPLVISFFFIPIKKLDAPLFSGLMYLVVLVTAGVLLVNYFHRRLVTLHEAFVVGSLWLVMNLIFDYPLFAFGPMKMAVGKYYSEIGVVYVTFPVFAMLAAQLAKLARAAPAPATKKSA